MTSHWNKYSIQANEAAAAPERKVLVKEDAPAIGIQATGPEIPGNATTTTTLTLNQSVVSDIGSAADQDWIAVELVAGHTYQFNVDGAQSSIGVLSDSELTLRNAAGQQLDFNDDANASRYSQITYSVTTTGTYYLDVGGYSGEVGGYRLTGFDTASPPPPSPLDSLDMSYIAPAAINVYFVGNNVAVREPDGTTYNTSAGWSASQVTQAMLAFQQIANVANVTFTQTTDLANADFVMMQATAGGNLGYFGPGGGAMTIGGVSVNVDGYGNFNVGGAGWNTAGLQQGGYGFVTMIHEIGHGMGLAHPHDSGGGSTVMQGVTSAFGDYGDFNLNQGIYTTMSYNDGWTIAPHGTPSSNSGYGWQGTMMALDIATLQLKYGANLNFNATDTTYVLPATNAAGSYYQSIWDTGGIDTIVHNSAIAATIDLRAASLAYDALGGGAISYATGIHGGFTIANGVVIENATGGSGNDSITGNDADNVLSGNGGTDTLLGLGGNDTLEGGAGGDVLNGGAGIDTASYASATAAVTADLANAGSNTGFAAGDTYVSIENLTGSAFADSLLGDNLNNTIIGGDGVDSLIGRGGADTLIGGNGDDILTGGEGSDILDGGAGNDRAQYVFSTERVILDLMNASNNTGSAAGDVFISIEELYGTSYNDIIRGDNTDNRIWGADGNDQLFGRDGNDTLIGGNGDDILIGGNGGDLLSGGEGNDRVQYTFATGAVTVDLLFLNNNTGYAAGDAFVSIEEIYGSTFNDILRGNNEDNRLWGAEGNDTLFGRDGNDILVGGLGDDILIGGNGGDMLSGGDGNDRVQYSFATSGVTVDLLNLQLNTGFAAGDYFVSIEEIYGSTFNDTLRGNDEGNRLWGAEGNDVIYGRNGNDIIIGGSGDDNLIGGSGSDTLNGGEGTDRATYSDATAGVTVDLANTAANTGFAAGDTFTSIENLFGSNFNDSLLGDAQNNTIWGGTGNDSIHGRGGNDILIGGTGQDTFFFTNGSGTDTISDFSPADGDLIDLTGYSGLTSFGQLGFNEVGANLHVSLLSSDTIVLLNTTQAQIDSNDFTFVV